VNDTAHPARTILAPRHVGSIPRRSSIVFGCQRTGTVRTARWDRERRAS
jgi:hypothetical protein